MNKNERNEQIKELYLNGKKYSEIGKYFNISQAQVKRIVRQMNLPFRVKKSAILTNEDKLQILDMYIKGSKTVDISNKFNCSDFYVRKTVKELGGVIKPIGGQIRKLTNEQKLIIAILYKYGRSKISLSRLLSIDVKVISNYLAKINPNSINSKRSGCLHHNWKGGKTLTNNNRYYQIILDINDPYFCMINNAGYVLEHRYVMAKHLGRPLTEYETVHHKDGNGLNNDINNLQLRQSSHGLGQTYRCRHCGATDVEPVNL